MREDNWGKRRVLEALEIQQRRPMMNLDAGLIYGVKGGHSPWHFNLLMTLRVETSKDGEPSSTDCVS